MLKIDMHTHIMPRTMPDFARKFGYGDFIMLDHIEPGTANMMQGGKFFRQIKENCWNPEIRIPEYAAFNTQVQVVCTIPVLFSYWAKPEHGAEVARFLNDDLAQSIAPFKKNYIGLGTLPMQDTDLAIKELQHCKELGFPGVQIGSNINDKNLDEPEFYPIFEACQDLGMAVFVHPWNMMGMAQMKKYWLPWLVGMPAETSRAICSMVFAGIFEKLPNLRVCFAHAGGSFIPTIGRIEHGFNCRPDLVAIDNDVNPREYLGKFWVDCITHDADTLKFIIDKVGSEKVCLGSDYPFPLGDLEIGKFIEEMGLPQHDLENIFCHSSLGWLGLDAAEFN
ncbi:MAG: amidohydrolase [Flavobacteriales bacterium]|nr:amidohydrolase [Flavobacteriales bacterium]